MNNKIKTDRLRSYAFRAFKLANDNSFHDFNTSFLQALSFMKNYQVRKLLYCIYSNHIISDLLKEDKTKHSDQFIKFIQYLETKNSILSLERIYKIFEIYQRRLLQIIVVTITTTYNLDIDLKEEIINKIKNKYSIYKIKIKLKIDPSIIGGLKIAVINTIIDGSITTMLSELIKS